MVMYKCFICEYKLIIKKDIIKYINKKKFLKCDNVEILIIKEDYMCVLCNKLFSNKYSLKRYMLICGIKLIINNINNININGNNNIVIINNIISNIINNFYDLKIEGDIKENILKLFINNDELIMDECIKLLFCIYLILCEIICNKNL